jgi:hypothetical protein
VTNETTVLRQSIYYPYAWALQYARGRVLELDLECESYPIKAEGLRPDFARDDRCRSSTSPRRSTRRTARPAC